MVSCLDPDPKDPRTQVGDGETRGTDAGTAIDGGTEQQCPGTPRTNEDDPERCVHTFVFRAEVGASPERVQVAGDFECEPAWAGGYTLTGPTAADEYTVDVMLKPGRYEYKFVVDGEWMQDAENSNRVGEDGNSILEHSCPASYECVLNSDCTDQARPVCRGYACAPCDCESGQRCNMMTGRCEVAPCETANDCDAGQVCADGVCRGCLDNTECGAELICAASQCREPECDTFRDCPDADETCSGGLCEARPCGLQTFDLDAASAGDAARVLVAGEFTDWLTGAIELARTENNLWRAEVPLDNGRYAYKFVLFTAGSDEPTWIEDPNAEESISDGVGGRNSVRVVDCSETNARFGRCGDPSVADWRDEIMYFVMVDRFYDSDGQAQRVPGATGGDARTGASGQFEGGDLVGVAEKLDYLQDLGVTSLWLSAPYKSRDTAGAAIDPNTDPNLYSGYHGYWPSPADIDYTDPLNPSPIPQVEPRIGTSADLRNLVDSAHASDMKVLFDYVMNHVDVESPLYRAHPDWFARGDGRDGRPADGFALCGPLNLWNDPYWGTRCAFTDYLPPFDFDNAAARAWSVADAIWWAREFNLDGFRLDAIKHVSNQWLYDLRAALDEAFPEPAGGRFYLVGETFAYDDIPLLASYIDPERQLDGQFDFPMKARLCEGVFQGRMNDLQGWMDNVNRDAYPTDAIMTTWIGNHDIPRAIHFASGEIGNCREGSNPGQGWSYNPPQPQDARSYELLGVSFGVLMTSPGIPLIYYGDEIGLAGGGDPDNRRMMPWNDNELMDAQIALRENLKNWIRMRRQYRALSRGRRTTLSSDGDQWVYQMSCGNENHDDVVVVVNRGEGARAARGLPAGRYADLQTNEMISADQVEVGARQIRLLKRVEE